MTIGIVNEQAEKLQFNVYSLEEKSVEVVYKKWGSENIIETDPGYTIKIMQVFPNSKVSLHYHRSKAESFVLLSGRLDVTLYRKTGIPYHVSLVNKLDTVVIPPCTPHTFTVPIEQIGETIFLEASTTDDPEDSYRLNQSTGPNE